MIDRLHYKKGPVGELQLSLETDGDPILLGNVHMWEDQLRVTRFVDEVNRLMEGLDRFQHPPRKGPPVSNR